MNNGADFDTNLETQMALSKEILDSLRSSWGYVHLQKLTQHKHLVVITTWSCDDAYLSFGTELVSNYFCQKVVLICVALSVCLCAKPHKSKATDSSETGIGKVKFVTRKKWSDWILGTFWIIVKMLEWYIFFDTRSTILYLVMVLIAKGNILSHKWFQSHFFRDKGLMRKPLHHGFHQYLSVQCQNIAMPVVYMEYQQRVLMV